MSLRTRLVLAFLLLAVVPLSGLTLQSYLTSRRALRKAVEAEAAERARDMNDRLDTVTADLGRRLETVSHLPLGTLLEGDRPEEARERVLGELQTRLGDAAGLVGSLSIVPELVASPAPAVAPQPASPPGAAPVPAVRPEPLPEAERAVVLAPEPPPAPAASGEPGKAPTRPRWVVRLPQRLMRIGELKRKAHERRAAGDKAGFEEAMTEVGEESAAMGLEASAQAIEAIAAMPWLRKPGTLPSPPAPPAPAASDEDTREKVRAAAREVARDVARAQRAEAKALDDARREEERAKRDLERAAERAAENAQRADEREADNARRGARQQAHTMLGRKFDYTFWRNGEAAGKVRANVKPQEVLERVFARSRRQVGEIPFALEADGTLHAASDDRQKLQGLPLREIAAAQPGQEIRRTTDDWVVVARRDSASGLALGIARPIGQSLKEIRNAAMTNLAYGLGIASLALVGILPLSRRMTRDLAHLSTGAERLASGDLDARVTVKSKDEIGRLAATFNRMAEDLRTNQERLLAQERLRKELEMCRRIQEEMLPHDPLRSAFVEVKGLSLPAREVGGDFFNYFLLPNGEAALLVGDVSGKGVPAALLMANLQATLRARLPLEPDLAALATHLDAEIEQTTPGAAYLTLFMAVLDGAAGHLRYVNAGHNPPFLLRADGRVEALGSTGRPLGLLSGGGYEQAQVSLSAGDSLFLYTDGVVESEDPDGDAFGMDRLQAMLVEERASGLDGILHRVEESVRAFRGGTEAADDATMVVLKFAGRS
jgi:serine phosphatase RsbU (regulator of sigma subunit)